MDVTDGPTDAMVVEVWQRVRPSAAQKVAVVASASSRLATGDLDEVLRADAWQQAHRLAGSLGSFGWADASVAAATAERILEAPTPADADELADAVARMERAVDPA